jgi:uncharacterized membrane protein
MVVTTHNNSRIIITISPNLSATYQQTIYIDSTTVNIEVAYRKERKIAEMSRMQLNVFYLASENNWEFLRIVLCNDDHKQEVGEFLNSDDRKKLKDALQRAGFIICRNKWWIS